MNLKSTYVWGPILTAIALAGTMTMTIPDTAPFRALLQPGQETPKSPAWRIISPEEIEIGATIPPNTNVIIQLPGDIAPMSRFTLLGPKNATIRYWGYCFREEERLKVKPGQLPGKVFLSEAERAWRAERSKVGLPTYSIYRPPVRNGAEPTKTIPTIRHQMERFDPGMNCYVMTSLPISIGTDRDGDGLNSKLENELDTDPNNADTDGDGVQDGDEVLHLKTKPMLRDTDGDGLIDGIEDANLNGFRDPGETNAILRDSDGDKLCDGYCEARGGIGKVCRDNEGRDCVDVPYSRWMGEDKNLDGVVDEGETDPRKPDTDGDGILDEQEYYNCLLREGDDC